MSCCACRALPFHHHSLNPTIRKPTVANPCLQLAPSSICSCSDQLQLVCHQPLKSPQAAWPMTGRLHAEPHAPQQHAGHASQHHAGAPAAPPTLGVPRLRSPHPQPAHYGPQRQAQPGSRQAAPLAEGALQQPWPHLLAASGALRGCLASDAGCRELSRERRAGCGGCVRCNVQGQPAAS